MSTEHANDREKLLFRSTASGWFGFAGAATFFRFGWIAFCVAVSMIGPVHASLSFIKQIIAAGFGVNLLGEPLTFVQIAGVALIIIALIGATGPQLGPQGTTLNRPRFCR